MAANLKLEAMDSQTKYIAVCVASCLQFCQSKYSQHFKIVGLLILSKQADLRQLQVPVVPGEALYEQTSWGSDLADWLKHPLDHPAQQNVSTGGVLPRRGSVPYLYRASLPVQKVAASS